MKPRHLVAFLLTLALVPIVQAATTIVVNSDDWMDVYSGLQYAYLQGHDAKFLTNKRYAAVLPQFIPRGEHVIIIESQRVPFTVNLAGALRRQDYQTETIYATGGRATNLELARLLSARKFIIVDPSYGYNAISAAPYAQLTGHYVLFADRQNIDQVLSLLRAQDVESLLLYGQIDQGLVERLAALNPEVINEGNRYKDNIAILRKHLSIEPSPQIILTDGSVIETELMHAGKNKEATLLIGRDSVPRDVIDFVKNNNFKSAVVVGTHLSRSGKYLKDNTGVPVFLKFAQGITKGTPELEPVKALDFFFLPVINLELVLRRAQYNTLTKNVELTYDNKGIRAFSLTSAGILANNDRFLTIGDQDVQRLEPNESISFNYPADLTEHVAEGNELVIDLFTLYGESPDVLDHAIALTAPLPVVTLEDKCDISVKSVQYNTRTQRFIVRVENNAPVSCHADVILRDVIVDDKPVTIEYPGTLPLERRGSASVEIKQRLTEVDLADNPTVQVRARYGEREDFLLSVLDVRMPVRQVAGGISATGILVTVIAVLIVVIVVLWFVLQKNRGKKW